jgi:hypothetical protein
MLYELPAADPVADLEEIERAIAASPIVTGPSWLELRLADWENTRRSADVDAVVLAWLVGHRTSRETELS